MPTGHLTAVETGLLIRTRSLSERRIGTHHCDVGYILDKSNGLTGLELAVTILFRVAKVMGYRLGMLGPGLRLQSSPMQFDNIYKAKATGPRAWVMRSLMRELEASLPSRTSQSSGRKGSCAGFGRGGLAWHLLGAQGRGQSQPKELHLQEAGAEDTRREDQALLRRERRSG